MAPSPAAVGNAGRSWGRRLPLEWEGRSEAKAAKRKLEGSQLLLVQEAELEERGGKKKENPKLREKSPALSLTGSSGS